MAKNKQESFSICFPQRCIYIDCSGRSVGWIISWLNRKRRELAIMLLNITDSPRLYLRNTIENSEVKLDEMDFIEEEVQTQNLNNGFFSSNYLTIKDALRDNKEFTLDVNAQILRINEILSRNNKHFGYRIRDEIVFYMLENQKTGLLPMEQALDFQIMQKILPTINGSDQMLKRILIDLCNFCNEQSQIADNDSYIEDAEEGISSALYVKSAKKVISMMKGFENGFVSYWQ